MTAAAAALPLLPELGPPGWVALGVVGLGYGAYAGYRWYQSRSESSQNGSEANKANEKADDKAAQGDQAQACAKNPCEHLKKGSGDGDYRGGAHGDPKKDIGTSSPSGDELDSHHMPAKQAYKGLGLDPADGPAIQMDPEDHAETQTYGGGGKQARDAQRDMIQSGDFDKAFDEDAENVRNIAKSKGQEGKYDQAIEEARAYKDCLKEHNMQPGAES